MKALNIKSSEKGNVLFYILIAVALLAALSFAVSQSGRGNVNKLSEDKARIYATDMIEYGNIIASAVGQLRLRGCSKNEINFENNISAGYTNPNAPADKSCDVFNINGGGVVYKRPPEAMTLSGNAINYYFNAQNEIKNIGTTCAASTCSDLLLLSQSINQESCIAINELLDITNPSGIPPVSPINLSTPKFTGTFGYDETMGDIASDTVIAGKKSGCSRDNVCGGGTECYTFFRVLWSQ